MGSADTMRSFIVPKAGCLASLSLLSILVPKLKDTPVLIDRGPVIVAEVAVVL